MAEEEIDKLFGLVGEELCSFYLGDSESKHSFMLRAKGDILSDWGL